MNPTRLEKRLKHKAIKAIMQTTPDLKYTSVYELLISFCKIFYKVTKIPVFTWLKNGGPVYPEEKFPRYLIKNCVNCWGGYHNFEVTTGKHKYHQEVYYKPYRSEERYIFTFAIDISKKYCSKKHQYELIKLADNYFKMAYPFISTWLGDQKMNLLKLPDIHYYTNQFRDYYGAIYLRPANIRAICQPDYGNLFKLYSKWIKYFDDPIAFDYMIDGDCLVIFMRYTTPEASETDYAEIKGYDIFKKIEKDSTPDEKPLYDAYNFYSKKRDHISLQDLIELRLTIMSHDMEQEFKYYPKHLITNHFHPSVGISLEDNNSQKTYKPETDLPTELVERYHKRMEDAQKEKKAAEMKKYNHRVNLIN